MRPTTPARPSSWPTPNADLPLRARLEVVHVDAAASVIDAPTVADAALFLAGAAITTGTVVLRNWGVLAGEPSAPVLRDLLATFGTYVVRTAEGLTCTSRSTSGHLDGIAYDLGAAPDLAGIALVLAAVADDLSCLRGVASAPGSAAVRANLDALGAQISDGPDGSVLVTPVPLRAGVWPSDGDAGLAALGAVVGLVVPGLVVTDADGVDWAHAPGFQPFLRAWRRAMSADEHILPGTSAGTVPYYA
jgi:3-phosphoshikimate 1-carboxyvinyltransferase